MRRGILLSAFVVGLEISLLGVSLPSVPAWADGPTVGFNAGAVIPLSKYRRTIDGDLGGAFGLSGGYRFDLSDNFAISLLGNPQFTFLPTQDGFEDDDVSSVFSITGGPRFSLLTGIIETYVGAAGGYYRDISGPMSDDGAGFNAGGGLNFEVARGTSIGLYGRYDYARMVAEPRSDVDRQWVSTGLAVEHVFLPPPPVVAQAPPPPPPPPPPPVKRKIVLRGVNFDFDKSNIRADARAILDEAISTLQSEPNISITVEGHTDAIGTDAYNQRLSERRAKSVLDYLSAGGITRSRMSPAGHGESKPVASNTTDDGRAQNRRVELLIVGQ